MMPLVTPQAVEILRAARVRIATPERWTQGTFGVVYVDTGDVICECVNGALLSAGKLAGNGSVLRSGASLCLSLAAISRGFESASKFNDDPATTHADVLALLDEASALAVSMLQEPS